MTHWQTVKHNNKIPSIQSILVTFADPVLTISLIRCYFCAQIMVQTSIFFPLSRCLSSFSRGRKKFPGWWSSKASGSRKSLLRTTSEVSLPEDEKIESFGNGPTRWQNWVVFMGTKPSESVTCCRDSMSVWQSVRPWHYSSAKMFFFHNHSLWHMLISYWYAFSFICLQVIGTVSLSHRHPSR